MTTTARTKAPVGRQRWTELNEEALAVLSVPSRTRTIPVTMRSLDGLTIYVADEESAQRLRDNDAVMA